jgi:hypothetical protein
MKRIINLLRRDKKITLREVASPKPSRTTLRILGEVLRRAYADQQATRHKAQEIRSN